MNYFSIDLCRKLASLGINTDSGMWYRVSGTGMNEWTLTEDMGQIDRWAYVSAYQMSDVFHKEALIKLFPEGDTTGMLKTQFKWQSHRDRMIEIYSESGMKKLEQYLMEEL